MSGARPDICLFCSELDKREGRTGGYSQEIKRNFWYNMREGAVRLMVLSADVENGKSKKEEQA